MTVDWGVSSGAMVQEKCQQKLQLHRNRLVDQTTHANPALM